MSGIQTYPLRHLLPAPTRSTRPEDAAISSALQVTQKTQQNLPAVGTSQLRHPTVPGDLGASGAPPDGTERLREKGTKQGETLSARLERPLPLMGLAVWRAFSATSRTGKQTWGSAAGRLVWLCEGP